MNNELIHDIALELLEAEQMKQPIERFTKNRLPWLSLEEAYLIQEALIQLKRIEGHRVLAPKLGLTSKQKMLQMGVNQPIYGYIFQEMKVEKVVHLSNYIHPKIEPEIGIVLENDLYGPGLTREDIMNNIAYVFSAVEIIDSRFEEFEFMLSDVIADNSSASGYIFSDRRHSLDSIDLANERVNVIVNDEVKTEGIGSNVLDHPAESLAILANMLGEKGQYLKKDLPILTGGMTSAVAIEAGDIVKVKYTTLPEITFEVKK